MAIDHAGLQVSDIAKSRLFYAEALAPLGLSFIREVDGWAGFGKNGYPELWIGAKPTPPHPTHLGFLAQDRETVHAFYQAALAAGGTSRSEPRIFDIYHPDFYAAMVLDPDGHNIEVVCHRPG